MTVYSLYAGDQRNGNHIVVAIAHNALKGSKGQDNPNPDEFFLPGTTGIKKVGEIEVDGDDHYCDEYFPVSGHEG